MNYNFLASLISVLPLLFFIYLIINVIVVKSYSILYLIGFIFTSISVEILKQTPYESIFDIVPKSSESDIFFRPKGAHDCDFLSMNGLERPYIRAMPSGHMALTSYFVTINILNMLSYEDINMKILGIGANILLLISMAWSRTFKLCHNKTQVFFGTLYGSIIGALFHRII